MSQVLTEGPYAGEFLLSEAAGSLSRDVATIDSSQDLKAGQVLGQITATKRFVAHNPAGNDGSEVAAAVLYRAVKTGAGETAKETVIARLAEVIAARLVWGAHTTNQKNAALATLAGAGKLIVAR